MKKSSLMFVLCLGLLVGCASGVSAPQASAQAKVSSLVAQTARVGLGQHLVAYLGKLAQSASAFVSTQPMAVKIGAVALVASGVGRLVARGVHWYKTGETGIASTIALSDTFQDAVSQWVDFYEVYHNKIEQTKRTMRFMVPAVLGLNKFNTLRAHHIVQSRAAEEAVVTSAGYFGLLAGFGDFALGKCVQLLSSVPLPSCLRTSLQDARANVARSLNNVKRIMHVEGITQDDLRKYEEERHIHLAPELKEQLLNCMQASSAPMNRKKQDQESQIDWVGDKQVDIETLIDQIQNQDFYKDQGVPFPRGILMLGDPGLGKTFSVRYIAQQAGCPLESIKATDLMTGLYVGTSACKINALYQKASQRAKESGKPCIVFIDEADAVLADRQHSDPRQGHSQVSGEILNTLFPLMDGDKTVESVITVLASNMPQDFFDRALVERTKRITHIIHMEYPDANRCLQMLYDAAKKHPVTSKLISDEHYVGLLANLAQDAAKCRFTPDNLYGFMEQLSRTIVADLSREIRGGSKNDQYDRVACCKQLQKRLNDFVITKEKLQDEFNSIKGRRSQERSSVQMGPMVAASQTVTAQPDLAERRRGEQQSSDRMRMMLEQYKERIGWLQTCSCKIPKRTKEQTSVAVEQQRVRSNSLLFGGLRPETLLAHTIRQDSQVPPEGLRVVSRARSGSLGGIRSLANINRDSAIAPMCNMSQMVTPLRVQQNAAAGQVSGTAIPFAAAM